MSIAMVRDEPHVYALYPRITHIPTIRMSQHLQWEDGADLSLFYHLADHKRCSESNKKLEKAFVLK